MKIKLYVSRSAIFSRVSVSKNCSTYISDICTIFVSGEKKLPNVLYLLPKSRSQKGQIVFFYSISVCASGAEPEQPVEAARQAGPYLEQGEGGDAAGAPGGLQGSARGGDHSRPAFSCSVDHYSL